MFYATQNQFGLTFDQVRKLYPNKSFPADGQIDTPEVSSYAPSTTPDYDPATHAVRETAPVGDVQQYEVYALTPEEVQANQDAKAVSDAKLIADKVSALWSAADKYTSDYISGVAIGILTIGVIQGKPKCLAVTSWSGSIWAEYYARKVLVTASSIDNLDFSIFGPIPHSVPELQAEALL